MRKGIRSAPQCNLFAIGSFTKGRSRGPWIATEHVIEGAVLFDDHHDLPDGDDDEGSGLGPRRHPIRFRITLPHPDPIGPAASPLGVQLHAVASGRRRRPVASVRLLDLKVVTFSRALSDHQMTKVESRPPTRGRTFTRRPYPRPARDAPACSPGAPPIAEQSERMQAADSALGLV
jgi:hypothetical protein